MDIQFTQTDIAIVGGGPAGLCAAIAAAELGASVCLIDRGENVGGQLVKQTHMFFGSKKQHASVRGIDIARILKNEACADNVEIMTDSTVLGLYEDRSADQLLLTIEAEGKYIKKRAKAFIIATGASEKFLGFPNNDLPGVYGAGAVQTLMNEYGVSPGKNALMVGAGNIGLIVSYQLAQAGVRVKAVIDAAPAIGGYMVHASKIRRMGIPIYTGWTVSRAHGTDRLERITAISMDGKSEMDFDVDMCCISVGLAPLTELLWQIGCDMKYIPELGGHVPVRDDCMKTSLSNIYVAGDAAGVEEASSAMVEGRLAGLCAAKALGYDNGNFLETKNDCLEQLAGLRNGPAGQKTRSGLERLTEKPSGDLSRQTANDQYLNKPNETDLLEIEKTGIPALNNINAIKPSDERLAKGPVAVIECFARIPCDPCYTSCTRGAIKAFEDINDLPIIDGELCNGCGICVSRCPGLAITVVDASWSADEALVRIPYEFAPLPNEGDFVTGLGRDGKPLCRARVVKVTNTKSQDRTPVVSLAVPKDMAMSVRFFGREEYDNTIICRCEEITRAEIRELISEGFDTVDEIKRMSRAGMGPCQGRTCRHLIQREIAEMTGVRPDDQQMPVFRPPVKPISLGAVYDAYHESCYNPDDECGRGSNQLQVRSDGGGNHE